MPMPDTDTSSPKYLRDKYAIVGRRRDHLHARLGHDDARARHLGGAQRHRGCRAEGVRRRRHAVLPVGRFDLLDLHRRRPRHPAQLLHGRVRRRLLDRGAGRHGDRPDRGRHVQDRGDLPRHERLLPGAHRRHRRARRGAGDRATCCTAAPMAGRAPARCSAPTFMRHMHDYGTTPEQVAHVQATPQPATPRTTRRPSTRSASRSTTCSTAASSASRCTCSTAASRPTTPPRIIVTRAERARDCRHPPALIRGVVGRCSKPRTDMHYQHGPISTRRRPLRQATSCGPTRASGRRTSTSPAPTTPSPSPPCCSSRITASARRARAATTSATARSGSAASGPTTPAAAISARATRTA